MEFESRSTFRMLGKGCSHTLTAYWRSMHEGAKTNRYRFLAGYHKRCGHTPTLRRCFRLSENVPLAHMQPDSSIGINKHRTHDPQRHFKFVQCLSMALDHREGERVLGVIALCLHVSNHKFDARRQTPLHININISKMS